MHGLRERLSPKELRLEHEAMKHGGSTVGLMPDGTWRAERVLAARVSKKRGRQWLVRWWGWSPAFDSWSKVVERSLIDDFLAAEAEKEKKSRLPKKEPLQPFSIPVAAAESLEVSPRTHRTHRTHRTPPHPEL